MPKAGEFAPDFELLNQDGQKVRLSDYRGQKVILFAFPKANTMGCNVQACGFRDIFPQIEESDAVVLGISTDSPEELKQWKQKKNLPYDLLSDSDHKTLDTWGAWNSGWLFSGTVRSHWVIGEDGKILDEQVNVTPKGSVNKALGLITLDSVRS